MATTFFAISNGITLSPDGAASLKKFKGITVGELCKVKVSQGRNVIRHRHYFAMLNQVIDQWPEDRGPCPYANDEVLLCALKDACGWWMEYYDVKTGEKKRTLKSIDWEHCDNPEFMERIWHPSVEIMAAMLRITTHELITNTRYE